MARFAWWIGIYLAGSWSIIGIGIWRFDFAANPLLFVLEPLQMPSSLVFSLPESWRFALFDHFPVAVASWSLDLVFYVPYLLNLVFLLCVKRFQSFCFLLVLLIVLIFLNAFGLAECIVNWPRPN